MPRHARDTDPEETREWLESLEAVLVHASPERATFLLDQLLLESETLGLAPKYRYVTPYRNTIPHHQQPTYPGDAKLEGRLTTAMRWNALAMVMKANQHSSELGGHIATYASAAELYEVAFQHCFKADDLVFFQPHAAPGIYARAFLEGYLTEDHLLRFRQEVAPGGLSSYPHPHLMPEFWQFPTGSMGLGPIQAIYQARLMKYLEHRELIKPSNRKVWCFVGDGEMDEPEARGALGVASREGLDNLIFVINCNLQRLDGPVRGNGKIIQELEALFRASQWQTIKVLWGSSWDDLFASDHGGWLQRRLEETLDGELQTYKARDGGYGREAFFGKYQELLALVAHLSDEDIAKLQRGGHDPVKIYAAYAKARRATQPTVILAQTVKGYGLGKAGQSKNTTHQTKQLDLEDLKQFREHFQLPLSDAQVERLEFYRPDPTSSEMHYLHDKRKELGGFLPRRSSRCVPMVAPKRSTLLEAVRGSYHREVSTTMVFNQLLASLLKDSTLGPRVVPIVPDEARTFGMSSLFSQIGIYSPQDQLYQPEDKDFLMFYKESKNGQLLQEGISEDGAFASWLAAATSYSNHALSSLPFYVFYSMFGFQRIGDLAWAAADSRARGFLMGATAGRTTLSGEGLQHQDGHSHMLASLIPSCRAYDPCFADELAVIVQHGIEEMLHEQQDVFYYVTLMNQTYTHLPLPEGADSGVLKGMYLLQASNLASPMRVQLLGSGTILLEVLEAAKQLETLGVAADVWSVTSFVELRRDGLANPQESFVTQCLAGRQGPVIAATDYVSMLPDLIRPFIQQPYHTLGTDGFGRSDYRKNLRRYFGVDADTIVRVALAHLNIQP
jgi:pyruvate dehydrogenase E1 component